MTLKKKEDWVVILHLIYPNLSDLCDNFLQSKITDQ